MATHEIRVPVVYHTKIVRACMREFVGFAGQASDDTRVRKSNVLVMTPPPQCSHQLIPYLNIKTWTDTRRRFWRHHKLFVRQLFSSHECDPLFSKPPARLLELLIAVLPEASRNHLVRVFGRRRVPNAGQLLSHQSLSLFIVTPPGAERRRQTGSHLRFAQRIDATK